MGIEELLLDRAKKQGIQKGEERGEKRGIQKGEHKKATAIAIEMKKEGLSITQISKFTKLSIEEIEKL